MSGQDQIEYTKEFKTEVKASLKARFQCDASGNPLYDADDDDRQLRHYAIELYVETPIANKIKRVDYYMDDESYITPHGFSSNPANAFSEEITSYGDVNVIVTVTMVSKKKYEQKAWLSLMLENGYEGKATPAIKSAIERIKKR